MLDAELLKHPVIRTCVDALVDRRGGLVVYEQGLGGRETLVAAAVRIAHATGRKLTIVDAEVLREATADLAGQLGLAEHTFLSPAQAARWPTGFDPDAVLAVHGDVLRNRDLVEPLRAAARDASVHRHLVVARHSYGSAALDTYTTQIREITAAAPTPAPGGGHSTGTDTPGPLAGPEADRRTQSDEPDSGPAPAGPDSGGVFWVTSDEPARRPDIAGDLETKRQFLADLRAQDPERRRRAMDLISPHLPADATKAEPISSADLGAALEDPGTRRAVQAKAARLQAVTEQRLRQAAEALAHRDTTATPPQRRRSMHPHRAAGSPRPRPLHHSRGRARRSKEAGPGTPPSTAAGPRAGWLKSRCGAGSAWGDTAARKITHTARGKHP